MRDFRTYQLAKEVFKDGQKLKLSKEMRDQFERSSLSVVLNLAEGSGRPTPKDRRRIFSIAMGSLREMQAILDLIEDKPLMEKTDLLAGQLFRLIQNPGSITKKAPVGASDSVSDSDSDSDSDTDTEIRNR